MRKISVKRMLVGVMLLCVTMAGVTNRLRAPVRVSIATSRGFYYAGGHVDVLLFVKGQQIGTIHDLVIQEFEPDPTEVTTNRYVFTLRVGVWQHMRINWHRIVHPPGQMRLFLHRPEPVPSNLEISE
jgi:hypothetical protein